MSERVYTSLPKEGALAGLRAIPRDRDEHKYAHALFNFIMYKATGYYDSPSPSLFDEARRLQRENTRLNKLEYDTDPWVRWATEVNAKD